jgi:hypothetical protein
MIGIYITYEETERLASIVKRVEIGLNSNGFSTISEGLYVCGKDGLLNTYAFMEWVKSQNDLTKSIKKIHAFQLDSISDFTNFVKNI